MDEPQRGNPVPDVRFGFGHDPDAPRRARQALQAMFGDAHDGFSECVRLAASELVTNVIVHTPDGGELRGYGLRDGSGVRLEVEDRLPMAPSEQQPPPEQPGGRGLQIVGRVSDSWGVWDSPPGKVVWAEFGRRT